MELTTELEDDPATKTQGGNAMEELLTAKQVCAMFRISRTTLKALQSHGHGPRRYCFSKRAIRYKYSDVIAWADTFMNEGSEGGCKGNAIKSSQNCNMEA